MNAKKLEEIYGLLQRWIPIPGSSLVSGSSISCLTWVGIFSLIAVGLAVVVPNYLRSNSRGQHQACRSNLKNIGTALEMYSADWSGRYPSNLNQLTPKYLKTIPECPAQGSDTYSLSYQTGPDAPFNKGFQEYYYFDCHGLNHEANGYPENRPAYDGIEGLRAY